MVLIESKKWELIDIAVKAFINKYPTQVIAHKNRLNQEKTEYGLWKENGKPVRGEIRHTLSFPVCINPKNGDEDCLFPVIKRIFKNFGDNFPKNKKIYQEFVKRYPLFHAADKI